MNLTKQRIGLVAATVAGLLVLSLAAVAAEPDTEGGDTLINYGYDEENRILVFNTSSTDGTYDCTLQRSETETEGDSESTYTVAYVTTEGLIEVSGLTSGADEMPVMFPERDGDGEAEYGSEEAAECDLQAADITGPAGQVNHGTFVSAVAKLYDGPHRGCVISHFARSGLGKGEQQIRTPDVEDEGEELSNPGTVDFTSIVTECERGPDDGELEDEESESEEEGPGKGRGNGKGKPDWAPGPPPWAGKPGR